MLRLLQVSTLRFRALKNSLHNSSLRQFKTTSCTMQTPPTSVIKPPNVLIFQPSKNSTSKEFVRTKEALENCLTPERYAIYALSYDEVVLRAPWRDNCRLVVVPPHPGAGGSSLDSVSELSPKVLTEFVCYLEEGGSLLSMNESLNRYLGMGSCPTEQTADVNITFDEKTPLSPDSGVGGVTESVTFHACTVHPCDSHVTERSDEVAALKISSKETVATFEQETESNTNQSNNVLGSGSVGHTHQPAVELMAVEGGGCAVTCGVDLLPLSERNADVPLLIKLKKDVLVRSKVMSCLLGMLSLECSEERLPGLTHTYLVCGEEEHFSFISACAPLVNRHVIRGREMSLRLIEHNYHSDSPVDSAPCPTPSEMALITLPAQWQLDSQPFNFNEYFHSLQTTYLGRTLLYTAVITSTQSLFTGNINFCNSLSSDMGVVSVAGQQTRGKGRGGNVWLSPKGSMMFSTILKFPSSSRLSQRLPLLQHLVALAVVHGVRTSSGYEDLPIKIKWPNDIYYKDQVKLGGILVTSFAIPNSCDHTAIVGCGVNVDNKHPTMSLNDCIAIHNVTSGTSLPLLSVESCLARTLNSLEGLLSLYERSGIEGLESLYYKYWLHSGATVRLPNHGGVEAVITGIDEYGYLLVRSREDGHQLSLQPDGNSFDIMKGLIAMKTRS